MVTNVPFHSFAMLPSSKQQHHRHEENCWETFCQYPIFKVSLKGGKLLNKTLEKRRTLMGSINC